MTVILDAAVAKSAEARLDADTAESLVLALQQHSRNFPVALRRPSNGETQSNRHSVIGNVHVSGLYYFSVIIATRQFLIQHIVPKLAVQGPILHERTRTCRSAVTLSKIARLADACVEAATFMAEMCHEVMRSGLLFGNMCIVK